NNASKKFNTYYKTLIRRDRVDEKYLNSQINAAYSVKGHDYYQTKENSKSNSLLSGTKQKSTYLEYLQISKFAKVGAKKHFTKH
ncbi:MAG: hypothetical protein II088_06790, partial [Bacteroidales bacterium]|nr:hypothetical protein [Bacteroidales bacterium]